MPRGNAMHNLRSQAGHLMLFWLGLHWVLLVGVTVLTTEPSLGSGINLSLSSQPDNPSLSDQYYADLLKRKSKKGGTGVKKQKKNLTKSPWQRLKELFARKQREAGTRSGRLCLIDKSKTQYFYRLWSTQPLFNLEGVMASIALYLPERSDIARPLQYYSQRKSIRSNSGKVLQQGQEYIYQFKYNLEINKILYRAEDKFYFKIIEKKEHDRIQKELIRNNLYYSSATPITEELILERAFYFANQDLFLDSASEIYRGEPLSIDLFRKAEQLKQAFCPAKNR